ncbi:uncharacterized protein LOC113501105 isoform X2 [Trichoplusia ni]|uniref:Uncharacterized protein LOC113501105 isoform X2 n=1 Tax=Trichoplusia ni TaxID=7111 RepID=A0A7E5WB51_TRINI|nr:uncharacterized protein LOC113501105 isoform X2 [Trichoplusia ni]
MAKTYATLFLVLVFTLEVVFCDDSKNNTTAVPETTTASVPSNTSTPGMTTTTTAAPTSTTPQTAIEDFAEMLKNLPNTVMNAWANGAQAVERMVNILFHSLFPKE